MENTTILYDNSKMLTGLFRDRSSAERAYRAVSARGYDKGGVNLIMTDETRRLYFSCEHALPAKSDTKAEAGYGANGTDGDTGGPIAAAVAAATASLIAPVGLVVATGPMAEAIADGATGGFAGGLVGLGIPDEYVKRYQDGLKNGGILMSLKPRSDGDAWYLEQQWKSSLGDVFA